MQICEQGIMSFPLVVSPVVTLGEPGDNTSMENIDNDIQRLQQEASNIHNQALELKRRRNASTPIYRLSVETLQYIFKLLSRDPTRMYDDWDWVDISKVCQKWRAIAMDTRDVWSTIICRYSSVRRIEMHLRLSRNANLTVLFRHIDMEVSVFKYLESFKFLLAHMERIIELNIEVRESVWHKISDLPEFDYDAPLLKSLDIQLHTSRKFGEAHQTIPFNLLSIKSLRKMHLRDILIPDTILDNLQSLELTDLSFDEVDLESLKLLDILRLFPKLESLTLANSWIYGGFEEIQFEFVELPFLRYLKLNSSFAETCNFFQYIKVPNNCALCIGFMNMIEFHEAVQTSDCRFLLNRPFRCKNLYMTMIGPDIFVQAEGTPMECDENQPLVEIFFKYICAGKDVTGSVDNICSTLEWIFENSNYATAEMVQLRLAFEDGILTQERWASILKHLNDATHLAILFMGEDPKTEEEFAKALRQQYTPEMPSSVHPVLCPKLDHLSLGLARFSSDFCLELEHTLRYRNSHDVGIGHLYVHDAFGVRNDQMFVQDLDKCVKHLYWDILDEDESSDEGDGLDIVSDEFSDNDNDENEGKDEDENEDEDEDENEDENKDEDGDEDEDEDDDSESELEDYITDVSEYDSEWDTADE